MKMILSKNEQHQQSYQGKDHGKGDNQAAHHLLQERLALGWVRVASLVSANRKQTFAFRKELSEHSENV